MMQLLHTLSMFRDLQHLAKWIGMNEDEIILQRSAVCFMTLEKLQFGRSADETGKTHKRGI